MHPHGRVVFILCVPRTKSLYAHTEESPANERREREALTVLHTKDFRSSTEKSFWIRYRITAPIGWSYRFWVEGELEDHSLNQYSRRAKSLMRTYHSCQSKWSLTSPSNLRPILRLYDHMFHLLQFRCRIVPSKRTLLNGKTTDKKWISSLSMLLL